VAMLWVGGHILLVGVDELGWHAPYELVHHAEEAIAHAVPGIGGFLAWCFNTLCSAIIGLVVGAVVVAVMHVLPFGKGHDDAHGTEHDSGHAEPGHDGGPAGDAESGHDAEAEPTR
jgi:hypothetical protein